jgi:signal transduction histidine kinase
MAAARVTLVPRPLVSFLNLTIGLALLALLAPVAEARVYQWQNPASGTVEFSGTPPAWYRSGEGGPRILVYQNGLLLDDTAVAVDPMLGDELREAAFQEFERRQEEEALKRLERAARRERARLAELERAQTEVVSLESGEQRSPLEAAVEEVPENLDAQVVERLKTLLQAWDRQQLE